VLDEHIYQMFSAINSWRQGYLIMPLIADRKPIKIFIVLLFFGQNRNI